jgi:hypothetical protein
MASEAVPSTASEAGPSEAGPSEAVPSEVAAAATKTQFIIKILNQSLIPCSTLNDLHGLLLPRELFFNSTLYTELKKHIPELKQIFSSSYMTALQTPAENIQKWPHLNLIRQILRSCHFKLTPKRVSDGYSADGKKKYKRMFIIEKMRII